MKRNESIALIAVTYKSSHLAEYFAKTAALFKHVWVVDNASGDGTAEDFLRHVPHARVIGLEENVGFGPANNIGFAQSLNFCGKALFLNPDCQIDLPSIRLLEEALDNDASLGIVSPVVFTGESRRVNLLTRDYTLGYLGVAPKKMESLDQMPAVVDEACLDGACFLVRSETFEKIGAFDNEIFMYSEEDDISLRLARYGGRKSTLRDAHAVHLGGASTAPSILISLRKKYHHRWSVVYMIGKYGGGAARTRVAFKTLVVSPFAIVLYALTFQKANLIKWIAWAFASFDGLVGAKFFRRFL